MFGNNNNNNNGGLFGGGAKPAGVGGGGGLFGGGGGAKSTGIGGGNLFATAMSGGKFSFGVPSNVDTTNTNGVGIFSFGPTSTTNDKVDDSVKASGNNTDNDDAQSTISSNVSDL